MKKEKMLDLIGAVSFWGGTIISLSRKREELSTVRKALSLSLMVISLACSVSTLVFRLREYKELTE